MRAGKVGIAGRLRSNPTRDGTDGAQDTRSSVPPGPGFAVLYRWRLHPGCETDFVEARSRVWVLLRAERGSLGSRLHRGADGIWYGHAQWPSSQAREAAFARGPADPRASMQMKRSIAEEFPEVILEPGPDFLLPFGDGTS
jgi:hypothetical protein